MSARAFSLALVCALLAYPLAQTAPAATKSRAADKAAAASDSKSEQRGRRDALAAVHTWAIQLRFIDREKLRQAPLDLIVIDHAPHPKRDIEIPFLPADIAALKVKPDGKRRIVLAYLSVGEAERYRYYWQPQWETAAGRPMWLGAENQQWPGDYQVAFANPEWQSIIFGTDQSYLDRIIAAGFDGVYLDRVDAFQDVEDETPGARDAMVGFVSRLADHAHRTNPRFLVVMQNAEELLNLAALRQKLDGVAKEDFMFGHDNTDAANPAGMVRETLENLRRARRAGLAVMTLEYVTQPEKIASARHVAEREGFALHITDRMLGQLTLEDAAPSDRPPAPAGNIIPAPPKP